MRFEILVIGVALVAVNTIGVQGHIDFPSMSVFPTLPKPAPPTWMTINTDAVFPCYDPQGNILPRSYNAVPCPHFKRGKRAALCHWDDKKHYWSRRGIPGPEAEIIYGNLRALRNYYSPRSLVVREWTKQYGKVYGMHDGANKVLVISDLSMMNELLVKKFDHFVSRIRTPMQGDHDTPRTNLVQSRGANWKRLRALASHAFTTKALKIIERTVEDSAVIMIEELKKRVGEVNIYEFYQEFTLDVICKISLGQKDMKMFDNPYMDMARNVFVSKSPTITSTVLATLPLVRKPLMFLLNTHAKYQPYSKFLMDVQQAVAQRKKARDAGSPNTFGDFIDIFLDAEVDSEEISTVGETKASRKLVFDEIVGLCIVMLVAGFETTSNSLAYLTHFLANYPDVQERMREEIEAVCLNEAIEYEELAELKYTEAAIKESLRHYPLASVAVSRDCQKATTIGNVKLEVGDSVLTDTWSMHMDKDIWGEDADEFRPERWFEDPSRPRVAFQAFGEGPRMCIGMRLSYVEEKTAMVHMLKNFTIKKCERTNPLELVGNVTVAPVRVDVLLERRNLKKSCN